MAQMSPIPSDASDDGAKTEKKASSKSPAKAMKDKGKEESEVEDSEPQSGGEGEGSGEEEEYEIEAILDAKKGKFPKNTLGYFVKWKGYESEHNSWVREEDAGNATELIEAFWKERDRKKAVKKTVTAETKRTASARKSTAGADGDSDVGESASAPPKKRGRKAASDTADKEKDTAKVSGGRPAKKPRLSKKRAASQDEEALPSDEELGSMADHMHVVTWDHLVKHLDTVERVDDGTLYVYFTLHTGERIRESAAVCADKIPKMLIHFYESNLRWKEADRDP
ncbi:hypothetical protein GGX14DRAFT_410951 [Mycena pura]|uniref:Chromo domain-containing protein n=1 Tax=Mycena pura TaxID=153505 RepID=A0AAD7E5Z0_9AGAR|nr:hypothetical protein GGX14DRAFT_410951 [Mycena pura]